MKSGKLTLVRTIEAVVGPGHYRHRQEPARKRKFACLGLEVRHADERTNSDAEQFLANE
jgi:hypothetical protein